MRITAIARNKPSVPARWLAANHLLTGQCLDYGSGRGTDALTYKMDAYDPHFKPEFPTKLYDTITCTYVLNVVPLQTQYDIMSKVSALLKEGGTAYFTVRRDIPKKGIPGNNLKDYYRQYYVTLLLPCVREISTYAIYKLEK